MSSEEEQLDDDMDIESGADSNSDVNIEEEVDVSSHPSNIIDQSENDSEEEEHQKLQIISKPGDSTNATYAFQDEDHTLGNALRYMIMKNPKTELCGYAIPHPSEPVMNLRVQTVGPPTTEVVQEALENLIKCTEMIEKKFKKALESFNNSS